MKPNTNQKPRPKHKNRDKEELFYVILINCMKEAEAKTIQAEALIDKGHISKVAKRLVAYGLLERREHRITGHSKIVSGLHVYYKITPKGRKYVQIYSQIKDSLKGFKE